uniref:Ycf36 n=1 Tax=Lophosiphonia teges TaxID=2007110 RepID=A0A1Z1MVS0_9FLOR|nr:hypothetical protein [Polysiphonia teges]
MSNTKSNCPVPFDQQPLNEYLSLKQSWLFSWSISSKKSYLNGLMYILITVFVAFSFIAFLLTSYSSIINFLLSDLLISNIVLSLLLIRIYLGWSYIVKRLLSATIFYEESGWYDGQVWVKTSEYLIQDRLIGLYEVMPFIARIKYTLLLVFLNFFVIYFLNIFL